MRGRNLKPLILGSDVVQYIQSLPSHKMLGDEGKARNSAVPVSTRLELLHGISTSVAIERYPTDLLMKYSGLAMKILPVAQIDQAVTPPVLVMTLPSEAADTKSLRYILEWLRLLPIDPSDVRANPQLRTSGLFNFSEAALLYRTVLQLKLPWDQRVLQSQLLEYLSEKPLKVEEIQLVWDNYPREDKILIHMVQRYVCFIQARRYDKTEKLRIKALCHTRRDLLAAINQTSHALRKQAGVTVLPEAQSHVGNTVSEQRLQRITRGLRPIDPEFLVWQNLEQVYDNQIKLLRESKTQGSGAKEVAVKSRLQG